MNENTEKLTCKDCKHLTGDFCKKQDIHIMRKHYAQNCKHYTIKSDTIKYLDPNGNPKTIKRIII